jgi:alpha-tubulin suppressor-like RCC1 family protein
MGYTHKGRLGCLSKDECDKKLSMLTPMEIKDLYGIQISELLVGNFHSIAITSKGKIFGWGENKNFVLGSEKTSVEKNAKSDIYYYPTDLSVNKHIIVHPFFILESSNEC